MDSLLWLWLALFGAAAFAFTTFFDKIAVSRLIRDPLQWYGFWGIYYLFFAFPTMLFLAGGFPAFNPAAAGAGVIAAVAAALYIRAVVTEDISNIAPLLFFSPLFTLVISVAFMNEQMAPLNYLGVLALAAGATFMGVRDVHKLTLNTAAKLALLNAFMSGVISILFRIANFGSRPQDVMLWYALACALTVFAIAGRNALDFGKAFAGFSGKAKLAVLTTIPIAIAAQFANITA